MSRHYTAVAAAVIGLAVACAAHRGHRDIPDDALCTPSDLWLTVANELVEITCDYSRDHNGMFDCEILRLDNPTKSRQGLFGVSRDTPTAPFDPTDESNYGAWDGCTIHLRDGRSLEEIEIISSGVSSPSDFK